MRTTPGHVISVAAFSDEVHVSISDADHDETGSPRDADLFLSVGEALELAENLLSGVRASMALAEGEDTK